MWGAIVIIAFVFYGLYETFGGSVMDTAREATYGKLNKRQAQLYRQYVMECRCLTDEDIQEAIEEAKRFEAKLKHKEIMANLKIDPNFPYKNPHPAIVHQMMKYAEMTGYERLLLAKKRFKEEGGKWDDRLNPFVPDGAPEYMYKYWAGSYKNYGGIEIDEDRY